MTTARRCRNVRSCPCCPRFTSEEEVAIFSDEESRALHARALAGSRAVSGVLWERLHEPLYRRLRPDFRGLDETDIRDMVEDAILGYAEHPERYDPSRSRLDSYLAMAARGDLLNLLEKRKRQPSPEPIGPVAEGEAERKNRQREEEQRRIREALAALMPRIGELLPEPEYREMLELMADGVRDSRCFAEVLGCADLETAEQRRRVKQAKDLIRLRLKRGGIRIERDGEDGDD